MNCIKKNTPKKQKKQCSPKNYFALSRVMTSTPTHITKCRQKPTFKTICKEDQVFNVLWDTKRKGKADQYIRNVDKALSALSQRCDLRPQICKEHNSKNIKRLWAKMP